MSCEIEYEYCAVNVFGWSWHDDMFGALDALRMQYDGKKRGYDSETVKKTHLRIFKIPKGHRCGWMWYSPVWGKEDAGADGLKYWLVYDTMSECKSGDLPAQFTIKVK